MQSSLIKAFNFSMKRCPKSQCQNTYVIVTLFYAKKIKLCSHFVLPKSKLSCQKHVIRIGEYFRTSDRIKREST